MTLLDVVMLGAVIVDIWAVWALWPLVRGLVSDLAGPDMPSDDWEPVCPHQATVYIRVDPFGLLCPDCAEAARESWTR